MKKLELKHLAPYLPYRLKVSKIHVLNTGNGIGSINHVLTTHSKLYKPILRPLSDYSDINSPKMIELNCDLFNQVEIYNLSNNLCGYWNCSYLSIKIMCENHIDFFGLIDKGLAIDINTLS